VLHFGHNVNDLGFKLLWARRLLVREFECFLFGTAIELPETGLLRIFAIKDSNATKCLSQRLIPVFIRVLASNIGRFSSNRRLR